MKTIPHRQGGVSIVTAIFLLVVLAGLGAAMVTLFTSQQKNSSLDVTGVHTYLAARSGLEWGLFSVLRNSGACAATASGTVTDFKVDINLPSNYYVRVVCQLSPDPNGFGIVRRRLTATACNQVPPCVNTTNHPDYVQRVVTAEF